MKIETSFRVDALSLLLSLGLLTAARGAGVSVGDLDVTGLNVGDTIELPVLVSGVVPEEFAGFQFEFDFDPAVLEFQGVGHGSLIAMEDAAYAVAPYSPNLWALEANANASKLLVAGMILMNVDSGHLDLLQLARPASGEGVLLRLRFRLLQKAESLVSVTGTAGRNLLAFDTLQPAASPSTSAPSPLLAGGTDTNGMGNGWELLYLGGIGNDPRGDFDRDGFWNIQEFLGGALPNNNTQAGLGVNLLKSATTGLNLFSIPLADPSIGDTGLARAADLVSALGGASKVGVIYKWNPATQGWTSHIASLPSINNFDLQAGMGLMVSVNQNISARLLGTPTRFSASLVKNADKTSLNIMVLPAGLTNPPAKAADLVAALGGASKVGVIYKWNPATQGWTSHIASLPSINNFDLEPGQPLMISVNQNIEWPAAGDWPEL
ncbi:MAG TPA: cohesin domain-containing protein [bacterium]|nr:cohesin domain-containing protein [bacterium]